MFAKPNSPRATTLVPELLAWLAARGITARLDRETAVYANSADGLDRDTVPEGCDLAIVLGGDGTLLSAARAVGNRAIPLLAVNLGGLGFLTAIPTEELFPELERTLSGEPRISRRKMLRVSLMRKGASVAEYQALNDVVIAKSSIARIVDLEAWVGDSYVCGYKADGLIISTPTGSTAYSLAAGGPIVYPTVNAICVTPICPHTLTNRPLIIPSDMGVRIVNKAAGEDAYLTVDGQVGSPLESGDSVDCDMADFDVLLIRPPFKNLLRRPAPKAEVGRTLEKTGSRLSRRMPQNSVRISKRDMNLEIRNPDLAERVAAQIQQRRLQNVDELLERALDALDEKSPALNASPTESLHEFLMRSPLRGANLDLERQKEFLRDFDFE